MVSTCPCLGLKGLRAVLISFLSIYTILTSVLILIILIFYVLLPSSTKMVGTRSQLENLSKGELIEELITVSDTSSKPSDLSNRFNDFLRRFEFVSSNLAIIRNCNRWLTDRVVQLEKNAVTNPQYQWWELVEVNPALHQWAILVKTKQGVEDKEFPGFLKKQHVEFPGVNEKWSGISKGDQEKISRGLGFWPWNFQGI